MCSRCLPFDAARHGLSHALEAEIAVLVRSTIKAVVRGKGEISGKTNN
jgi:hypothetical protein